jgi:quercetin dioxygenase-like cupin family protein
VQPRRTVTPKRRIELRMTNLTGVVQQGRTTGGLQIRLGSAQSGGELGVVELHMPPRSGGPPLHVHPTHGEGFYVLAGHPAFQLGTQVVTGGIGAWVFAPRETPHTLANPYDEPALLLCIFAPGGFERRFERILAKQSGGTLPDELLELTEAERATRAVGPPLSLELPQ